MCAPLLYLRQDRLFLRSVLFEIASLQPDATVLLPFMLKGVSIFFIVRRNPTPHHDRCVLTLLNCATTHVDFHRCTPEPPKLKAETALEIFDVRLTRLQDEAVSIPTASTCRSYSDYHTYSTYCAYSTYSPTLLLH